MQNELNNLFSFFSEKTYKGVIGSWRNIKTENIAAPAPSSGGHIHVDMLGTLGFISSFFQSTGNIKGTLNRLKSQRRQTAKPIVTCYEDG